MRRLTALMIVSAVLLAGCAAGLPSGVVYPSITPTAGAPRTITHEFAFEHDLVSLVVTVDSGVYEGATASEKTVTRFGNAHENDWIEEYYPAFINEEHQQEFYAGVIAALEAIRDSRGLDSDRYAELMTVFVQSLTYQTDPVDLSPKFPIETFVDGAGDCDDKTLLLAGLLSREGYDVAIMLFEPEQHVALGIRSEDASYRGTGYAYVETTNASFVGMVPTELAGGIVLASKPRLFKIDGGATAYTAGDDVEAILDARARAIADADALSVRIQEADASLKALEAETRAEGERLETLKAAGRIEEYNAAVPAYNGLAERYNAAAQQRNELATEYNALAEIERVIVEGLDDRPGTFAAVVARTK